MINITPTKDGQVLLGLCIMLLYFTQQTDYANESENDHIPTGIFFIRCGCVFVSCMPSSLDVNHLCVELVGLIIALFN